MTTREDGKLLRRQFNSQASRCERGEVWRVQAEERHDDAHLHRPEGARVLPIAHEPGKHVLPYNVTAERREELTLGPLN